jgi:hypothetical protein
MSDFIQYDITSATLEEFVSFLFDHEPVRLSHRPEDPTPWYVEVEYDPSRPQVLFDPSYVLVLYTQLFTEPMKWLSRYSKAQLEQGCWAMLGGNLDCGVMPLIGEQAVSYDIREGCVRSMFFLFERFFSAVSLETYPYMWWDALAYDWECGNYRRENGGEDLWMQDAMFETLTQILNLPSVECQQAALHGLGHLHHPDTEALVLRYLARNEPMDPELRAYAEAASRFNIQ